MKVYREITDWNYPNHDYIFNDNNQCIGYIKCTDGEIVIWNKPSKQFSKSRRKFKKVPTPQNLKEFV